VLPKTLFKKLLIVYVSYNLCALFDEFGHWTALQILRKPAQVEFAYQSYVLKGLTVSTSMVQSEQILVIFAGPLIAITLSLLLYILLSSLGTTTTLFPLTIAFREMLSFYPASQGSYTSHGMMLDQLTHMPVSYLLMLLLASAVILFYAPQKYPSLPRILQRLPVGNG
jgi:hypothetical protein